MKHSLRAEIDPEPTSAELKYCTAAISTGNRTHNLDI